MTFPPSNLALKIKPNWQRSYTVDASDNVTVSADRVQVEPYINWKPVVESDANLSVSGADNVPSADNPSLNISANCKCKEKENMAVSEKKKSLIQSLISGKSPFTVANTKALEEMDEKALEELDGKFKEEEKKPETPAEVPAAPASTTTPATTTPTDTSGTVQVSAEELQSLRQVAAQFQAQQENAKTQLIKSLLSNPSVSSVYKEEDLRKKALSDLSDLAKICKVETAPSVNADFSVIPFTSTSSVNRTKEESAPGPTVSLAQRLKEKRAAAKN